MALALNQGYTNAEVKPLHDPWPNGRGLHWEIRGYIDGVWVNVPYETEGRAKEALSFLLLPH